ncbi:MAG: type II toxin-antitoxin system VapC family toxin [Chloroflexota bacterium]
MTFPIFLDANVPIYVAGQPHPLQKPCVDVLMLVARFPQAFVTDAEVLQELLHRYRSRQLWPQGRQVVEDFATLMLTHIEPVYPIDVMAAVALADQYSRLSARDLLHVAIMDRLGARQIVTADRDFDEVEHISRLDPADLPVWQDRIVGSGAS